MLSLPFSVVQVMQSKAAAATQAWCHLFPSDTSSLLGLTFFFFPMAFLVSFQATSISTDVVMGLGPKIHLFLQSYFPRGWGAWKT